MDSKGDGRHFFRLFSTRFGPVYMVVCRSAGGWFGRFGCALIWVRRGVGNVVTIVFTWLVKIVFMDSKGDGRHFFRVCFWLCFPLVLGLCIWWFAVVQAAGVYALAVL